jgi:retinol dehydrogenase-12
MVSTFSELFAPAPTFTSASLIDLSTKVYIITHATAGFGFHLTQILYSLHATVYIGAHTVNEFDAAAKNLRTSCPDSKGSLKPFIANMANLATIKPAVSVFLEKEWRLDVLFLNSGDSTMTIPSSILAKGNSTNNYDTSSAANCLAPFLLTSLLLPVMHTTAGHFCHPNPSIRVVWIASLLGCSKSKGGMQLDSTTDVTKFSSHIHPQAGRYLLAHEFGVRQAAYIAPQGTAFSTHTLPNSNPSGVQHVVVDIGFQEISSVGRSIYRMIGTMSDRLECGANTLLYAGVGPDVRNGDFVIPWGRKGTVPTHIVEIVQTQDPQGKGASASFYELCEEQVAPFM